MALCLFIVIAVCLTLGITYFKELSAFLEATPTSDTPKALPGSKLDKSAFSDWEIEFLHACKYCWW